MLTLHFLNSNLFNIVMELIIYNWLEFHKWCLTDELRYTIIWTVQKGFHLVKFFAHFKCLHLFLNALKSYALRNHNSGITLKCSFDFHYVTNLIRVELLQLKLHNPNMVHFMTGHLWPVSSITSSIWTFFFYLRLSSAILHIGIGIILQNANMHLNYHQLFSQRICKIKVIRCK
jgi:hypothetical protein